MYVIGPQIAENYDGIGCLCLLSVCYARRQSLLFQFRRTTVLLCIFFYTPVKGGVAGGTGQSETNRPYSILKEPLSLWEKSSCHRMFLTLLFFFSSVAWHGCTELPFTGFIRYCCDLEWELPYRPCIDMHGLVGQTGSQSSLQLFLLFTRC